MSEAASTGNAAFVTASQEVTKLSTAPSNDIKLQLYANFKQGINGDNTTPAPGFMDFTGKAKWNAWTALKGTSKEDAQAKYIALVEELKKTHA
ncbi:acyl-CoA-binding protein [Linderina pennispora]|uniref:Acyl-CoA-binding protein n=1 Tax=Linderina pennispora TaxID=61395 RepID=A0A1Y1WK04_9FUNG|nr:acyl-CoA-binding protein [Linderina pennispora]ORX73812.1 acyl-CoA-binding protein [Linderina pennispora]